MQGQTQSSESIWTQFNSVTTAYTRHPKWFLKVSWKRVLTSTGFGVVGSSLVGGTDIIQGLGSVVTETDKYRYYDETERLIRFEWDRTLQEPLGGMAMCIGNILLENTDGRFTPEKNATIGTAILPNRPLQMFIGFLVGTLEKTIPIFKGLTKQPKENKGNATTSIECFDYVRYLNEYPLETAIYIDKSSSYIITDILNQVGFGSSQYSIEEGLNTIGFAWFEKGQTAGERIRKIAESEGGTFYQDEAGVLRFNNRRHYLTSPYNRPVWDIDPDDIVQWEEDDSTGVINRVIVKASPRNVQATREIWRDGIEEQLSIGETKEVWASFDDPITGITAPSSTTDYLAYTGTGSTGSNITSGLAITTDVFTTAVKLTLTNNAGANMYVPFLRLRGTPATVTSTIQVVFEDTASIAKYNQNQLEIENDYIDTQSFATYLAKSIVRNYKNPHRKIKIMVQGIPQLQLSDMVSVKDIKTNVYTLYRVIRIQGSLDGGLLTQQLYLREVDSSETDTWAIVGSTVLGSTTEFVSI